MHPFPTLARIESLDALTKEQHALLDEVLMERPELARASLAVYRFDDGRPLVSVASEHVKPGDTLVCTGGWAAVRFRSVVLSDGLERDTELHLARGVEAVSRWLQNDGAGWLQNDR